MYQLVLVLDVVVFAFLVYLVFKKDKSVRDGDVLTSDLGNDVTNVSKA